VKIRKEGEKVIIEPLVPSRWPDGLWALFEPDPDFPMPQSLPSREVVLD
jgi:virulence-associated protein VagC